MMNMMTGAVAINGGVGVMEIHQPQVAVSQMAASAAQAAEQVALNAHITLRELKGMIETVVEKKLPTFKTLMEMNPVAVARTSVNGAKLTAYENGYAVYEVDSAHTVMAVERCGDYRYPNLMGHSRPKYNSAVSTFCWAVANDESFTVNDRSTELELLYIDDLVEGMFDLLEGKEQHCEFDGVEAVADPAGCYCYVPVTHKVTLGEIVDLLQQFKEQPLTLMMPKMPAGSFAKKLYSLYLTYLPTEKFKYALNMNVDNRGSFTELVHTEDCGQVSINISRPGITKGQHWHNSKWELFIVVAGHGLIQERNINTGETVEFEISGDKIEAVHMIPGWTHNIINLSETENLVTVMTCNEIFDPGHPDTFGEPV